MNIKTPLASGLTDGGVTFEQACEIHRLCQEDMLTASQIARVTGIVLALVCGVLVGKHFPGALRQWKGRE